MELARKKKAWKERGKKEEMYERELALQQLAQE